VNKNIAPNAPTKREKRRAREAAKKAKGETQVLVSTNLKQTELLLLTAILPEL
jgi:hypothetical protein